MTEKNYATAQTLFLLNFMVYLPRGRLAFPFVSFTVQFHSGGPVVFSSLGCSSETRFGLL